jgi:hypothetical protein
MKTTLLLLGLLFSHSVLAQSAKITLNKPTTLVVDSQDNVFVGDGFKTYKIAPNGDASIFLDSEKATSRELRQEIYKMAIDAQDNIYSIGQGADSILKITPDGQASNYLGNPRYQYGVVDGIGSTARFSSLATIAIGPDGKLFVTDRSEKTAQAEKERYRSGHSLVKKHWQGSLHPFCFG